MAIALTPPAPSQELEELRSLLGSDGEIGRFVGRSRAQIGRWRKGADKPRSDSVALVDGAWHAVLLMNRLVAEEQLPAALHQQWPLLQERTPAEVFQDQPAELLETLRSVVEGQGMAVVKVATETSDTLDEGISEWFAANIVPDATVPAPVFAAADEDEDDDELPAPPRQFDDSWRGGRSASSDRWF